MSVVSLQDALGALPKQSAQHQRDAAATLAEVGFPGKRTERWKYTPSKPFEAFALLALAREATSLQRMPTDLPSEWVQAVQPHWQLVLIDGVVSEAHTKLPEAVELQRRIEALPVTAHADNALLLLNRAIPGSTCTLRIPNAVQIIEPVHVLHVASAESVLAQTQIRVDCQPGSRVHLVEHIISSAEVMHNLALQIDLESAAQCQHTRLQTTSPDALISTRIDAQVAENARFETLSIDTGGDLVRNDLNISLAGEQAHATLNGVYLLDGKQHVDNHTLVRHNSPNTTSSEDYRGVLRARSRAIFNGKVYVAKGADGTDASQSNRNLLLSDHAEIDTKPELEIYADDVKCAHGATVGQFDDDALFYLRSRGVDHATATQLLTFAFCREALTDIDDSVLRAYCDAMIAEQIPDFTALDAEL
ncbi:MAG: Fe-S cluster assembly protein SufD [Pseudomonadota bacterium]